MRAEATTRFVGVTSNMELFSPSFWKWYQIGFVPVFIDCHVVYSAGSANWLPQGCLRTALLSSIISVFR